MPLPTPARTVVPAAASSLTAGLLEAAPTAATVLAAHRFGLYLAVGPAVLPVLTSDAVPLPTAVRLAGRAGSVDWSVAPGDRVEVGGGRVVLPSGELVVARTWRPSRVRRRTASGRGGIHWQWGDDREWLADGIRDAVCSADPEPHVRALLGRGAGLTPSGDDALAGALLVGHGLGTVDRLAAAVRDRLGATTAVSAALLDAAADGYAARPVVRLVDAAVAGNADAVSRAMPAVLAIGHTSGADLVTGIRAALRARGLGAGSSRSAA